MNLNLYLSPESFAAILIRIFTGVLFLFQGYDKIFRMGLSQVEATLAPGYRKIGIPSSFIRLITIVTSWIELLGGAMLILGLLKYTALYLLGADLLIVATAFSILNPMWDMQYIFPRLILIIILLILPPAFDVFSLDHLLFR